PGPSLWCQPDCSCAASPCEVEIVVIWLAVLTEVDVAELRERGIGGGHVRGRRDDLRLGRGGLGARRPALAFWPDGGRFAGAKVPSPPGRRADQEVVSLGHVRHRDAVVAP